MLQSLHIRHLLLMEKLDIDFDAGLNIISGESGAGKSLVLYAIALLLGARFDHSLLAGGRQASVSGAWRFEAEHEIFHVLEKMGIPTTADEAIMVRRQLGQTAGIFINDTPISLRGLRGLAEYFAEMYGQFAAHRLQEAEYQRYVLDDFAALLGTVQQSRTLYADWQQAREVYERVCEQYNELQKEAGYLEHTLQELDDLDLGPDEFTELTEQRRQVRQATVRLQSLSEVHNLMRGEGGVAVSRQIEQMQSALAGVEDDTEIKEFVEGLERARIELVELERSIEGMFDEAHDQESGLEDIEERLFRISELARKHRTSPEKISSVRDNLEAQLQRLDGLAAEKHRRGKEVDDLRRRMDQVQASLSKERRAVATRFADVVNAELPHLHLPKAALGVEITPLDAPSAAGCERVQFFVQTQEDVPMRPLMKVVSGGELSRLLLAIALCLGETQGAVSRLPLMFDEVDAGMGGETAAVLGTRMQKLARSRQVLAVTHSPQMAASAECHIVVQKREAEGQLKSTAHRLNRDQRREEIARMLAGETLTQAARTAAEALLIEQEVAR